MLVSPIMLGVAVEKHDERLDNRTWKRSDHLITYYDVDLAQDRLPVLLAFATDAKGCTVTKTAQSFLVDQRSV